MERHVLILFFISTALSVSIFYYAPYFAGDLKSWIVPLLGIVMFAMGSTLEFREFAKVLRHPRTLWLGVFLQFTLMPFIAFLLIRLIHMPHEIAIGMILVGASPGGTASNLITYLARGNTALSITMTAVSTLLSFFMTPFLVWLYLDASIALDMAGMVLSVLKIVIFPVLLGIIAARLLPKSRVILNHTAPYLSVTVIALIIGIVIGLNHANFQTFFATLLAAVILHNLLGLFLGYRIARISGCDSQTARTIAIEVGMQNSALAVVLATKFFTPSAALAGALFSVWHNISGMAGSYLWNKKTTAL